MQRDFFPLETNRVGLGQTISHSIRLLFPFNTLPTKTSTDRKDQEIEEFNADFQKHIKNNKKPPQNINMNYIPWIKKSDGWRRRLHLFASILAGREGREIKCFSHGTSWGQVTAVTSQAVPSAELRRAGAQGKIWK